MLNSLSIKNFALIEDIELSLDEGLSIITGETGAGKSILLGALSLLLGKRADFSSIRNPDEKCVIEGIFSIATYQLEDFFAKQDLDYEPESIIRREILPSGKSRAFVNDTPVRLQQLTALGIHLVDIHSQHETLFIGDTAYQYEVLDALAGNEKLLSDYSESLKTYKAHLKELKELEAKKLEAQKTYDYNLFLLNELRESQLKPGIQEELEEQYQQYSNVEELKEQLFSSLEQLQREDLGIIDSLREVRNKLDSLQNFGHNYRELATRMESALLEVEDMTIEIERLSENIEDDPQALAVVSAQLENLYQLQKKHGLSAVDELIALQNELEEKVAETENAEETTEKLHKIIESSRIQTQKLGDKLTKNRKKTAPKFTKSVQSILNKLGMPDAQLKVQLEKIGSFNSFGNDEMKWLFSANKGGRFQELHKSASGGELSRITLAIKSILAQFSKLPTLIFDEIDTGVSGEIAQKMGDIMNEMSAHLQVISITHLPQIAAKGNHHFKVFKEVKAGKTQTTIQKLNQTQRIDELAEMLGGKEKSDSAIAHAKALLQ